MITQLAMLGVDMVDDDSFQRTLDAFGSAAQVAVPSLLGLQVTLESGHIPVTFSALPFHAKIAASLRIEFSAVAVREVVFYAGDRHACDQLGSDIPALLDIHRDRVVIDGDLQPTERDAVAGLRRELLEQSVLHRALGILLDGGMQLEQGREEIAERADRAGSSIIDAARQLIREKG